MFGCAHRARLSGTAQLLALVLLGLFLTTSAARPASMTAALDRDTVPVGESVTLTLTFEGGAPDAGFNFPAINNLRITNLGSGRNVRIVNGRVDSTLTQSFSITPMQPGVYQIPALQVKIGGATVSSTALQLTALAPGQQGQGEAQPLVFMRLNVPEKEAFVGQALAVELLVCVRDGLLNGEDILRAFDAFKGTPITAEGFRVVKTVHSPRRRAQVGSAAYTVTSLVTGVAPAKPGTLTIGSIEVPLTVQIPVSGQRRRDMFDPFGMFQQAEERQLVVVAPAINVNVAALPQQNVPKDFTGAVGDFQIKVQASPTNVAAGDPVTVRVRLEGQGDLESLSLPQLESTDFKTYPPSATVEPTDALGFSGAKVLEQVMVPQSASVDKLPGISFAFFNPKTREYQTVSAPPVSLSVKPGSGTPSPVVVTPRTQAAETPAPAIDIVPIKRRLGTSANITRPLFERPAFIALQLVPVGVALFAILWRKRAENLANNPRLRRQKEVRQKMKVGLAELKQAAARNDAQSFYDIVFRLLQEQTGERLNVPASSITAAVVEERLEPAGVPQELTARVRNLFEQCDQARYAPQQNPGELEAMIPDVEQALSQLAEVSL